MQEEDKERILKEIRDWFKTSIAKNHLKNTQKLKKAEEFIINPFLVKYLSYYFSGKCDAKSLAEVLVYPRILGTSATTSMGQNLQNFIVKIQNLGFGSAIPGIDIEFEDYIDKKKKYCQVKMGPNTLNKDDVKTIDGHFNELKNRAKTNGLTVGLNDLVIGVLYGEDQNLSSHYKSLRDKHHYPIFVGKEFWKRLTGDDDFYIKLSNAIAEVAVEFNAKETVEDVINALAKTDVIQELAKG